MQATDWSVSRLWLGLLGGGIVGLLLLGGLAFVHLTDQGARQAVGGAEVSASAASGTLRACRAADLNVIWIGSNAMTGGQLLGSIGAGNQTTSACILRGMPGLEVLGPDGRPLGVRGQPCPPAPTTVELFKCEPDATVTLAPGRGNVVPHQMVAGQATLQLTWHIHDGAGFCRSPTPPGPAATLRLTLRPSGDQVSVAVPEELTDLLGRAACGGGTITYFPFREVTA